MHDSLWHNPAVAQEIPIPAARISERIRIVQTITILWMALEAGVSLLAAWTARSPALAAFGGDSLVELLSAGVVLWRFTTGTAHARGERIAARVTGLLLFALGAYVVIGSIVTLLGYNQPKPSLLGMAILAAACIVMPWLGKEKRRLSALTGSAAIRADAAQSNVCAYLASVALLGLAVNALWRIGWADPVAALAVVPLIGYEGVEALRGKHCGCA